jgi:hypothetical protein
MVQVAKQRVVCEGGGPPRTVTVMETVEQVIPRLVADTSSDLAAQVAELRRALGVAADAELTIATNPEVRKSLIAIKVKLGLITVAAMAAATDTTLSVSYPLTPDTDYKIVTEIVRVTAVKGTTLGPTTVTVIRGRPGGTAATAIPANTVIEPAP